MKLAEEHGFWDYTAPGAGGMEGFEKRDYDALLEDMVAARMNSVCVTVKWLTTGYRSKLRFLDQDPKNPMIRSDNQLLRDFFSKCRKQGIKPWLNAVVNMYPTRRIKARPFVSSRIAMGQPLPFRYGLYDLDLPVITDYALQVFSELYEQFPMVQGFVVEVEHSGREMPHRIPLYNRWAKENGRPPFRKIGHPLNPRLPDISPWRDYTTHRRCELMRKIQTELRRKGFRGDFAMLCETGRQPQMLTMDVNLAMFRRCCRGWSAVTYEYSYNKAEHRHGMMELCLDDPKRAGLKTYYLPRGVMTYAYPEKWPLPITLQQSWQRDLEDILRFKPDGVW